MPTSMDNFFVWSCIAAAFGTHSPNVYVSFETNLNCTVIVVYNTLLTFSREVTCIWRRKFSAVTVLFFTQRYCMLILAGFRYIESNATGGAFD